MLYTCIPTIIPPIGPIFTEPIKQATNMLGAIIGGIIAGLILIIVLIVVCFYFCFRRNEKNIPIGIAQPQELKPLTQAAYNPQQMMVQPQIVVQPIMMQP
jgi:hypothetical protein